MTEVSIVQLMLSVAFCVRQRPHPVTFLVRQCEGAIPPDTRVTAQQRARAKRMLRAVDGFRDGATQQDIAQILFRAEILDRARWQDASARHAIKSLLREARALISGGYLRLLRHRRRA